MKQCPACKTTYTDESLLYCLADGAALESTEEETLLRTSGQNPLRVTIPQTEKKAYPPPLEPKKGSPLVKILLAVVALGIVVIGAAGIIGGVIYFSTRESNANTSQVTKSSSPTPIANIFPTVDPEKQRLQDQLANAQKQLEEQKNANVPRPPAFPTPGQSNPGVVTARVNSPGDGFLALRSAPSSDYGTRIAKIPHGATVTIENCNREKIRIGNRTGRWCMVSYGNDVGWVFDAWLDY
jgi:hypothetical protein